MKVINACLTSRLYLPAHIRTQDVFEVIQKVMGYDFVRVGPRTIPTWTPGKLLPNRPKTKHDPFDPTSPSSESNNWRIEFTLDEQTKINVDRVEQCHMIFKDLKNYYYRCEYFLYDSADNELEQGQKALYPPSSLVGCFIGEKLADFFGGKFLYREMTSEEDADNWYCNYKPKFPKVANIDERDYLYQNLLFNEAMMTAKDLIDMKSKAYFTDWENDLELIDLLQATQRHNNLNTQLGYKKKTNKLKKFEVCNYFLIC